MFADFAESGKEDHRVANPEQLLIPKALCGIHKNAGRAWKKITRKAIKARNWDPALEGQEFIPLRDAPGNLVISGPYKELQGEHVLLYEVMNHLTHETHLGHEHVPESNALREVLILDGLKRFWFCLALLGADSMWFIEKIFGTDPASRRTAAVALPVMLEWLPTFVALEPRFLFGIIRLRKPGWANRIFGLCSNMGVSEEIIKPVRIAACDREIDHEEVARVIRLWLKEWAP